MKLKQPFRLPRVLEIGRPLNPVAALAWEAEKEREQRLAGFDKRLDDMMRELWSSDEYWHDHGLSKPTEPYPGIEAIRKMTGVTP